MMMSAVFRKSLVVPMCAAAAVLAVACSSPAPTPTPVDAETTVDRAIGAMKGISYETVSEFEWNVLNRGTGERDSGGEHERTRWSEDGSWERTLSFTHVTTADGYPVTREFRCVDDQYYQLYGGEEWTTSSSQQGCSNLDEFRLPGILDIEWTGGPSMADSPDGQVLRLVGERLVTEERDGQPDPSSFSLTTVRLDVDPETFRVIENETVTKAYRGEDAWGINPDPNEPVGTYTTVTTYSKYGEPVAVKVPEGLE
jgi:hypothetical protein